jgi:hypothetical protein
MSRHAATTDAPLGGDADTPVIIPAIELRGSAIDRLRTLDAAIARLQSMRRAAARTPVPGAPANEFYGPYVNAPVWPWTVAGWALAVVFMLLFLMAWLRS